VGQSAIRAALIYKIVYYLSSNRYTWWLER